MTGTAALRPYFEIRLLPKSRLGKHEVDGGRVASGSDGGRPAFSHNEIEDAKQDELAAGCDVLLRAIIERANAPVS